MGEVSLLRRFSSTGFESLVGDEAIRLAAYLEDEATRGGSVAKLYLAELIRDVHSLLQEHDERGGVRLDFIRYLDKRLLQVLPSIQAGPPFEGARVALDLRNEMRALIGEYDPSQPGGL